MLKYLYKCKQLALRGSKLMAETDEWFFDIEITDCGGYGRAQSEDNEKSNTINR
jgi:hypothetical protein